MSNFILPPGFQILHPPTWFSWGALLVHLTVLGTNWQRISLPLFFIVCFRGGPLSKPIQRQLRLPGTEWPWAVLHHSQLQIVCSDLSWPSFNKNAVERDGDSVLDFSVWVTHVSRKLHVGHKATTEVDL